MKKNEPHTPKKFIVPLYMNGLRGRMLKIPSASGAPNTEILLVYGQKSSLEKWFPLAEVLSSFGTVTVPDLPGFGGMESFYKLGTKPSIDSYADYLAAFIKLKYNRKKMTIIGLSFGFVVVTRMLQKYPELTRKVNLLFSVASFTHHEDLKIRNFRKFKLRASTKFFSYNLPASGYRAISLRPRLYNRLSERMRSIQKASDLNTKEFKAKYSFDLKLRRKNNVKTHMYTMNELLHFDNSKKPIDLPVWFVTGIHENHLVLDNVENHLKEIYQKVNKMNLKKHILDPFMFYSREEIEEMVPQRLRTVLARHKN